MSAHGFRGQYTGFDFVTITPFELLLDFDSAAQAGLDSQTYGLLLAGDYSLDEDWTLLYSGSVAYQANYQDNPNDFGLWYYRIEPGISYSGVKFVGGYEVLQGNGTSAFQTPLATLHAFNGLTDQFLTTPPDGLQDLYISADVPIKLDDLVPDLTLKAGYHQFWADNGGAHYGWEWNAGLFTSIPVGIGALNLGIEYASYNADTFSSDTNKLWLTAQFQLGQKRVREYLE